MGPAATTASCRPIALVQPYLVLRAVHGLPDLFALGAAPAYHATACRVEDGHVSLLAGVGHGDKSLRQPIDGLELSGSCSAILGRKWKSDLPHVAVYFIAWPDKLLSRPRPMGRRDTILLSKCL